MKKDIVYNVTKEAIDAQIKVINYTIGFFTIGAILLIGLLFYAGYMGKEIPLILLLRI